MNFDGTDSYFEMTISFLFSLSYLDNNHLLLKL